MTRNWIGAWSTMILANMYALEGSAVGFVFFLSVSMISFFLDIREDKEGK